DGELARLKFLESHTGALLDFWGDNVVHVAVFAAIAIGWSWRAGAAWPLGHPDVPALRRGPRHRRRLVRAHGHRAGQPRLHLRGRRAVGSRPGPLVPDRRLRWYAGLRALRPLPRRAPWPRSL